MKCVDSNGAWVGVERHMHAAVSENYKSGSKAKSMLRETPNLEIAVAKRNLLSVHSVLVLIFL